MIAVKESEAVALSTSVIEIPLITIDALTLKEVFGRGVLETIMRKLQGWWEMKTGIGSTQVGN